MKRLFPVLILAISISACGGSPTSASSQPYSQTLTGTVSLFGTTRHSLTIPRSGQMRLTLSWTGVTDLDLYLTNASCQALYPQNACGIVLASNSAVGTQEVIARSVTAGETYAIFVDNLSLVNANSYTLDIRIQ
jgi:hypothetical protein